MRHPGSTLAALVMLGAAAGGQPLQAAEAADYAYIGTYTRDAPRGASGKAQSEGIYVAKVDQETGQLELLQTVAFDNPSFLAFARSAVPLRHQRGRGFRGQGGGHGRGLSDRLGQRRDRADQPATVAGADPGPSRGRPER